MTVFGNACLLASGLAACLVSVGLAAIPRGDPGDGPFLVIAAPWGGGPAGIVARAGGQSVGPESVLFAVLATDVSPKSLQDAGAWLVTSPSALPFFCDPVDLP